MSEQTEARTRALEEAPVIVLTNVSKRFDLYESAAGRALATLAFWRKSVGQGAIGTKTALQDVSLSIRRGEKVGLIGHNGAGKTTLLNLVLGVSTPSTGHLRVHGRVHGLMAVGSGYDENMTGNEVIRSLLMINGLSRADEQAAVKDIEAFVELGEFLRHPVRTYSLGMRARLEFAIATAVLPDIIAIDEVLGAGDGYFAQKSARRMRELTSRSTLLLVAHSMRTILDYCSRALWLNDGRIAADGPAEEVVKSYEEYMVHKEAELLDRINTAVERKATDIDEELSHLDSTSARLTSERMVRVPEKISPNDARLLGASFAPSGAKLHVTETGAPLEIVVRTAVGGEHARRLGLELLAFSPAGQLLWDARTAPRMFSPGEHELRLSTPRATPGVGDYVITVVLEGSDDGLTALQCLDCMHCVLKLRMITTNYSDPPLFHCAGKWRYGADGARWDGGRVSAWV